MKFSEAMKALQEKRLIRCKSWAPNEYISITRVAFRFSREEILEEWEIYEHPIQKYNFMQILRHIKEGKKVRRLAWTSPEKVIRGVNFQQSLSGIQEHGSSALPQFTVDDFEASDWVVVP